MLITAVTAYLNLLRQKPFPSDENTTCNMLKIPAGANVREGLVGRERLLPLQIGWCSLSKRVLQLISCGALLLPKHPCKD